VNGGLDSFRELADGETITQGEEFSQPYYETRDQYSNLVMRMSKDLDQLALIYR